MKRLITATVGMLLVSAATTAVGQEVGCKDGLNCPKQQFRRYEALPLRAGKMIRSVGHPHPVYAHSRAGVRATRTHRWNQQMSAQYPWHGAYAHPSIGQPLSLVVPPTASYQSVYSWGVGNTKSVPIYHQFDRAYPGPATGAEAGMYRSVPVVPWNTQQFGVYYNRAPW